MSGDLADFTTPEEADAHEVRRLRWILRVSNVVHSGSLGTP